MKELKIFIKNPHERNVIYPKFRERLNISNLNKIFKNIIDFKTGMK